jgi:hypothetical protein
MPSTRQSLGATFDSIAVDLRRLSIAHCVVGIVLAAALWARVGPEYFGKGLYRRIGVSIVIFTALAWLPVIVSWVHARRWLPGTGATPAYIVCLGVINLAAGAAYAVVGMPHLPALLISLLTTGLQGIALLFCVFHAPRDVLSSNKSMERTRGE